MKDIVSFLLLAATISAAGTGHAATLAGCQVLPTDNIWNAPVDTLPTAPNSELMIANIGAQTGLHPDFGSGKWEGANIGIPITVVDSGQAGVSISFSYADESDPGPYPIPPDAAVEGAPNDGDRHVLVLDQDNCIIYEIFYAWLQDDGSWEAGSGAVFDLSSNALRPADWTSADAAGLPILPGLVRYEEAASGLIDHAIRFTVSQTRNTYTWPARHKASDLSGNQYPQMGQRFRLKPGVDISGYSPIVRTILQAMKTYGIILADNGSDWFISGAPSENWDNDILRELFDVKGSDFEAVDVSSLILDADSGQVVNSQPTPVLTLNIAAISIGEGDGPAATTATVSRNTDTGNPLAVSINGNDTSEAEMPAMVVIPAGGATSSPFSIHAVDDYIVDGSQTVTVTASAAGFIDGADTLQVTDGDRCFAGSYMVGPVMYTGLELLQSTALLETSGPVTVAEGADVIFEAVDGIVLKQLFEVNVGATFSANAGPNSCSD